MLFAFSWVSEASRTDTLSLKGSLSNQEPTLFVLTREATQTGMARLALSDDDARVRSWFADEVKSLGCSLTIDEMGNMFARRAGSSSSSEPMTAMGSHLDTQPRGGRYDGILGVTAALEVLKTLRDASYDTHFDVGVVNWTKWVPE